MAQGVLERKQPQMMLNPAARSVVDALNAGRYQAWARAKTLAFNRSVITPVLALWAWLKLAAEPVSYKIWRFFAAAAGIAAIGAGHAALCVSGAVFSAGALARNIHIGTFRRLRSALLLAGFSVAVFIYGFYGMGLEVFVDGESVGYVNSQEQFERAVAAVSAQAADILEVPFTLSPNTTYKYSLVSRGKVFNRREVENMLFGRIPELKVLDILTINGEVVVGVSQRGVIAGRLESILSEWAPDYDTVGFAGDVSVTRQLASAAIEMDMSGLDGLLNAELTHAVTAFAEEGIDIELFANGYGMSAERLFELNSEYEDLSGQELVISRETPMLQVLATRKEVYTEQVYFETEYVDDPNMYTTSTRVVTEGEDGYNTVTANISYINGRESDREILDVENTLAPVTRVIAQGTLTPPTFIRPFWGRVTSTFGMRRLFGRTAMHTGIDFAGPIGSPVVSSSDGVVTFAGTKTGYGLCVIIKHPNGLSTLYGHNSRNLVKAGDSVKQGDLIARVGNTGRSTGPHVHFEIRVNDKPVNPFNYIR
ncbi:MAG: peptidoglycan DD-metalloendopeptidase family protein [Oscillospiraceae bacterium]|nr:peptidoglycan DD-metalloendopeptidase family protein [Oscillospiraceae bacterium]